MKRFFCSATTLVVLLLFALPAFANEWQPITDEIDVDFSSNMVRAYAVVKRGSNSGSRATDAARKSFLTYFDTLTAGKERTPLKAEFAKRPALYAKVQHLLERNIQSGEYAELPATDQFSRYFLFDLKLLKGLIPELNFPAKEDSL